MLLKTRVSDKSFLVALSEIHFVRSIMSVRAIFQLKKTERHYSEWGTKSTSIFQSPMLSINSAWKGRPKGALMQTEVCVRQGLRFPAPRQGAFLPLDPDQPCAVWMPGTYRRSITTKGADPLPLTPPQPCAGWMRGRASAPCTTAGGFAPCDPLQARSLMSAYTASWYHCSRQAREPFRWPLRCRGGGIPLGRTPAG